MEKLLHRTIKKVGDDILAFKFNTAISAMMIFVNVGEKDGITKVQLQTFLKLLAPFAPHIAEDMWSALGGKKSIHVSAWPAYDESHLQDETATIVVQVNGKVRGQFSASAGIKEEEARTEGKSVIAKWLDNMAIKKVIFVPGRLVNFVVAKK